MLLLGKKRPGETKSHKRFRQLSNADILDWADTVGTGIATSLLSYRKTGQEESLLEARRSAQQLNAAIEVLHERY